jgi:hypothetical protein
MNIEDITPELLASCRMKLAAYLSITLQDMAIAIKAGSVLLEVTIMSRRDYGRTNMQLRTDLLSAVESGFIRELLPELVIEHVFESEARVGLFWSEWLSLHSPSDSGAFGDEELLFEHVDTGVCGGRMPVGLYCRATSSNVSWEFTGQKFQVACTLAGIVCLNADNPPKGCQDYEVKLLCPSYSAYTPPPRLQRQQYEIAYSQAPRLPVSATIPNVLAVSQAPTIPASKQTSSCSLNASACSGHGQCDAKVDACNCDSGWFTADCSKVPLEAVISGNSTECDGPPAVVTSRNGLPGLQSVFCLPNRTSWLARSSMMVRLLARPTSPVVCKLLSSDASVAIAENATVRFTPSELIFPELRIDGVKDVVSDLDREFHFTVRCTSADRRFEQLLVRSNSAFTHNVPFPTINDVFPLTLPLIGQQVTIRGAGFLPGQFTFVGRVLVSGPSVERTIMVNKTDDSLWQIEWLDPDALAWISTLCAGRAKQGSAECESADRRGGGAGSWSSQRRKPAGGGNGDVGGGLSTGGGGGGGGGGGSDISVPSDLSLVASPPEEPSVANQQSHYGLIEAPTLTEVLRTYDKTWYDAMLAKEAARNVSDDSPGFYAATTYANWTAPRAFNLSNFSITGFVLPGPMHDRMVLGVANASIADSVEVDPETGEMTAASYVVVHEIVQPFNFTTVGSELRLISPPLAQMVLQDFGGAANGGYAEIQITLPTGPGTRLSSALFFAADCARRGWVLKGSRCRPCPLGGCVVTIWLRAGPIGK